MMIDNIISLVLKQRVFILVALGLIISGGIFAFKNLPIDAFPDVTNVQVQIITEAAGRSPIEVEKFVTAPIEVQMTGLPGLTELRSLSKFGLSVITVVFEDNVDIYFARQLILERLIEAKDGLPEGSNPVLGPVTTGLGEIYYYTLEFPQGKTHTGSIGDLTDLRTVQDWTVRPLLKNVPGVADINSFGGYVKQYQVIVNPTQLLKYDLTLDEVFNAVSENNNNAGGNVIEHSAEQYVVRGLGLIQSASDIENIVVKVEDKVPVYVKDIADVNVGPEFRQGAMVIDGKREGVGGIVMMTRGGNGKETVALIKKKVSEINKNNILPDGIKIKPYYDRSQLVEACLKTVTDALRDGIILVVIILYLFLRNLRGALVVSLTLPIVILITFIVMWEIGLSANLMSLGGLAISLGMIVDAAIIQIENIQRHFGESLSSGHEENKLAIIRKSVSEVSQPAVFGQLIIAITFIPIITLQGMEGKMFSPLALIVVIAIFASLVVSIFVTPVLASYFLKKDKEKKDRFFNFVKNNYMFLLKNALKHRIVVLISTLFLFLGSMALIPHLGTEFIPVLDEGSMALGIIRLPSVSLSESVEIEKTVERVLMKFPEVQTVVSKIGTAEIATDPEGPNMSDMVVVLKPREEWTTVHTKEELVNEVRESLEQIPGIGFNISQPIALRVDELISGVKSQLAVKLFGDDLGILKDKADEIAQILSSVKGAADLRVEQVSGQSYVEVYINRNRIARYGINVADVQEVIETAIGGKEATEVLEGEKRFSVLIRFPEKKRNSIEAIGNILIPAPGGYKVPMAQLASINLVEGPAQISRENTRRRIVIECNVKGRDIGSFVAESQKKLNDTLRLPSGYYMEWGGSFQNQQRAMKHLMIIVPITIALIFFLLFTAFNSLGQAALVIINLPLALIGGVVGLFISGMYLSVPAAVGFIALFGVAVLNGVVLVTYINQLRQEGLNMYDALTKGCEYRLRPVLMTASVTILGLIPLLFATGPGSEVQKPLAVVVVGGLLTSTFLTLVVLPVFYGWFVRDQRIEF